MSRSGYYAWIDRPQSNRVRNNEDLLEKIRIIYAKSRKTYGAPRIHAALKREGVRCGRNRVARLMRRDNIVPKPHKRYMQSTALKAQDVTADNIVQRRFNVSKPNKIWASDITCFWTKSGWFYLAVVIDLYSRKVIGWSMAGSMAESLPKDALTMALLNRRPQNRLIHHSDRGAQYTSYNFKQELENNNMLRSLSRKGDCYDNAVVESFFKTLKAELNPEEYFTTQKEARIRLFDYIEVFYNRQRLHSALGYMSPQEFEAKTLPLT